MDLRSLLVVATVSAGIGAIAALAMSSTGDPDRTPTDRAAAPNSNGALAGRIAALELDLEEARRRWTEVDPRTAPPSRVSVDVEERLEALEARVRELESRPATSNAPDDPEVFPTDREGLERALEALRETSSGHDLDEISREVELLRELLERYPDRENGWLELDRLVGLQVQVGDHDRAMADIDNLAAVMGIEPWRASKMRGGVASQDGDFDGARGHYRAVVDDPNVDAPTRADASFWEAYTFMEEGRSADARRAFEDLLVRFGDSEDPRLSRTVGGARAQLDRLGSE